MTPLQRTHNTLATIHGINSLLISQCWRVWPYVKRWATPKEAKDFYDALKAAGYGTKIGQDGAAILVPMRNPKRLDAQTS